MPSVLRHLPRLTPLRYWALTLALGLAWSLLLMLPVLVHSGWPANHDGTAQVARMAAVLDQWHLGHAIPVWSTHLQGGYGSSLPALYHKTSMVASAAMLGLTGSVEAALVVPVLGFLVLDFAGVCLCVRQWAAGRHAWVGWAGGAALLASNYATTDWLVRGAFAELAAMMLLPWLVAWCLRSIETRPLVALDRPVAGTAGAQPCGPGLFRVAATATGAGRRPGDDALANGSAPLGAAGVAEHRHLHRAAAALAAPDDGDGQFYPGRPAAGAGFRAAQQPPAGRSAAVGPGLDLGRDLDGRDDPARHGAAAAGGGLRRAGRGVGVAARTRPRRRHRFADGGAVPGRHAGRDVLAADRLGAPGVRRIAGRPVPAVQLAAAGLPDGGLGRLRVHGIALDGRAGRGGRPGLVGGRGRSRTGDGGGDGGTQAGQRLAGLRLALGRHAGGRAWLGRLRGLRRIPAADARRHPVGRPDGALGRNEGDHGPVRPCRLRRDAHRAAADRAAQPQLAHPLRRGRLDDTAGVSGARHGDAGADGRRARLGAGAAAAIRGCRPCCRRATARRSCVFRRGAGWWPPA